MKNRKILILKESSPEKVVDYIKRMVYVEINIYIGERI